MEEWKGHIQYRIDKRSALEIGVRHILLRSGFGVPRVQPREALVLESGEQVAVKRELVFVI